LSPRFSVFFLAMKRLSAKKCPQECPILLKYIIPILILFKKNRNSKTFPPLGTLQTIAIVVPNLFCHPDRLWLTAPQAEAICFVFCLKLLSSAILQHVFRNTSYTFLTVLLILQSSIVFFNLLYYRLIRVYHGVFIDEILFILYNLKIKIFI